MLDPVRDWLHRFECTRASIRIAMNFAIEFKRRKVVVVYPCLYFECSLRPLDCFISISAWNALSSTKAAGHIGIANVRLHKLNGMKITISACCEHIQNW